MNLGDLREEIDIEFEYLNIIVNELLKLRNDLEDREPTIREVAATP